MQNSDLFKSLTRGTKFNSTRFTKQLDVFKKKSGGDVAEPATKLQSAEDPVSNLKKRKKHEHDLDVEEDGAAELFRKRKLEKKTNQEEATPVNKERALELANLFRKRHKIKVSGSDAPSPMENFEQLNSKLGGSEGLVESLVSEGFKEPSPIQMQAIPALVAERDVVGIAPTGSGKTLAFLVPMVMCVEKRGREAKGIKAVIVSPTKELAVQTSRVLRYLTSGGKSWVTAALLGKSKLEDVKESDVVLATPLKLASLVEKKEIDLSNVTMLILDEADRLFEREKTGKDKKKKKKSNEGEQEKDGVEEKSEKAETGQTEVQVIGESDKKHFLNQIDGILSACTHPELVRALFSATFPGHVEALARNVLQDPISVTVGKLNSAVDTVKQHLIFVGSEKGKLLGLRQLLDSGLKPPILVFVNTKDRVKALRKELLQSGVKVDCIHSDQNAQTRLAVVDNFRAGRVWVLIATDVLGRGIDFLGVKVVVNFDFPRSSMDYIHRIGRTGRAGRSGEAHTLYTEEDACHLRPIANLVKESGGEVPEWMLRLKKEKWSSKVSYGRVGALPKSEGIKEARMARKLKKNKVKNLRKKSRGKSKDD
ncbi:hypothetical protein BSKO_00182 [Bryopsis sp. KO-2023]|nr:hypothetical protein BSKO_00182 [Bryopsis sp. KO-2023]